MIEHDILNIKETADLLRTTPKTLRKWVRTGKIPGKRVGGRWLFHKTVIINFIAGIGEQND